MPLAKPLVLGFTDVIPPGGAQGKGAGRVLLTMQYYPFEKITRELIEEVPRVRPRAPVSLGGQGAPAALVEVLGEACERQSDFMSSVRLDTPPLLTSSLELSLGYPPIPNACRAS